MIKLGIVMDPISSINIKKDSSFAMLLEAQNRKYQLFYMEMHDLFIENGLAKAKAKKLVVQEDVNNWYSITDAGIISLSALDIILMRKDPPFDQEYIYATYILELAEKYGCLVVNKPQSLRDCNEKLFTTWFPHLTPATLVTRNTLLIKQFYLQHKDIILKPLDGMGGASIFRVASHDPNLNVIIETLTNLNTKYCMVQKYIPEIIHGDKRIIVVNGEVIPFCLARIPKQGETRGNLAAGGTGEVRKLTTNDLKIAEELAPILKSKGLIFVGLDIIGDKLTEINVTSPTCIREIEDATKISISSILMDQLEKIITKSHGKSNKFTE